MLIPNFDCQLSARFLDELTSRIVSRLSRYQSQNYVTTHGQLSSQSWFHTPSRAQDQNLVTIKQLRICWCEAPSLTRGRVCSLQFLLGLASAVFHMSESRGIHDYILLSKIWDSQTWWDSTRIYFPQEQGNPVIRPGSWSFSCILSMDLVKKGFQQFFYCCVCCLAMAVVLLRAVS
jgi:hypothetical protein